MNFNLDTSAALKHFSKAANQYDKHAIIQREIGLRLFERLDYMSIDPKAIIDLGSGTGFFSMKLAERYSEARVIAVDHSAEMLAEHEKRSGNRCELLESDMSQLPLADNSVDLVFANLSVHWAPQLLTVLLECHRVLRPEGLILFSTMGPQTFYQLRESFSGVDDYSHVHPFLDMHHVGDALMKARFYQPVVDREQIVMTYPSVKSIFQDLHELGVQNADQHRARGLMGKNKWRKVIENYERFKTAEQQYPLNYEVIYGQAWAQTLLPQGETRISADSIPFRK